MAALIPIGRRLAALELRLTPRCPACGDFPSRLLFIHGPSGDVVFDTYPSGACPECGRATQGREHHIVADEWDVASIVKAWGA